MKATSRKERNEQADKLDDEASQLHQEDKNLTTTHQVQHDNQNNLVQRPLNQKQAQRDYQRMNFYAVNC